MLSAMLSAATWMTAARTERGVVEPKAGIAPTRMTVTSALPRKWRARVRPWLSSRRGLMPICSSSRYFRPAALFISMRNSISLTLETDMKRAAQDLDFEKAIGLREELLELKQLHLAMK